MADLKDLQEIFKNLNKIKTNDIKLNNYIDLLWKGFIRSNFNVLNTKITELLNKSFENQTNDEFSSCIKILTDLDLNYLIENLIIQTIYIKTELFVVFNNKTLKTSLVDFTINWLNKSVLLWLKTEFSFCNFIINKSDFKQTKTTRIIY